MGLTINYGVNRLITVTCDTPIMPDGEGKVSKEPILSTLVGFGFEYTHKVVFENERFATLILKS
jgi:hypothetical protein